MALTFDFPRGNANAYTAPTGITPLSISAADLEVDYQWFRDDTAPFTDYSGNSRSGELRLGGPSIEPTPNYIREGGAFTAVVVILTGSTTANDLSVVSGQTAANGIQFRVDATAAPGITNLKAFYRHSEGTNRTVTFGNPGIGPSRYAALALTWDGVNSTSGQVKAFLNGAQFGSTHTLDGALTTLPDGTSGFNRLLFLQNSFAGDWAWLSFYSRALTDAQILADYQARQNRLRIAGVAI